MKKFGTTTQERVIFNNNVITLTCSDFDKKRNYFTIEIDDTEVHFNNRKTDWNGILGDFWEFVKNYNRDKITLAHCEDLWRTDDREELNRVYTSYLILSKSIISAFGGNVCLALEFAEEYLNQ